MNFLLLHQDLQPRLLSALDECRKAWEERDRLLAEEEQKAGVIRCYSNMHLVFEMPISSINLAERVSFTEGIMGPPRGEYFFLLGDNYRKDLSSLLEKGGHEELAQAILNSRVVTLPEVHSFVDSKGDELLIIGWDERDARERLEREARASLPVRWNGSWLAFPSRNSVCLGRSPFDDSPPPDEEAGDVIPIEHGVPALTDCAPEPDAGDIPSWPDGDDIPF